MSIKAISIKPGDRITFPFVGKYRTRTVYAVGDNYVTAMVSSGEIKVPEHHITSHIRGK